jgi:hypothetical protein
MKKPAISRRQFLQYTAISAGALSFGNTFGEQMAEARAVEISGLGPPQGGNPITYIPHLNVPDDAEMMLKSPSIWVAANTDKVAFGDRIQTPLTDGNKYYIVAQVRNEGFAPVFNALVNFYVTGPSPLFISSSARTKVPISWLPSSGRLPPDVSREHMALLRTVPVNIPAKGMADVICPVPWAVNVGEGFREGRAGIPIFSIQTFLVRIVVECFDPLTDPLSGASPTKFNVNTDRHVAANEFLVRRYSF